MIWYSPKVFNSIGFEPPKDFRELEALVDVLADQGNTPWAMGFESGEPTGWAGSDLIQDLLLMTGGSDYVSRIIKGATPYNSQGVVSAYEGYVRWAGDDRYTVGGADGTLHINFIDAIFQVVDDPHQAMMVYQASWVGDFLHNERPELAFEQDYDFFPFPGGGAVQGAAEWLTLVNPTPASVALMSYVTSAEGARNLADLGFGLSPNLQAAGAHKDPFLARLEAMLSQADGFTLDIGDTIGGEFASAEWQAIVDVLQGADIRSALQAASEAQARTLGNQ
jgi:alpha-glucoside transport system substrate-binding protein